MFAHAVLYLPCGWLCPQILSFCSNKIIFLMENVPNLEIQKLDSYFLMYTYILHNYLHILVLTVTWGFWFNFNTNYVVNVLLSLCKIRNTLNTSLSREQHATSLDKLRPFKAVFYLSCFDCFSGHDRLEECYSPPCVLHGCWIPSCWRWKAGWHCSTKWWKMPSGE